jgi:hypothetical protein
MQITATITYTALFDSDDLIDFVGNNRLTNEQLQTIANILCANIEWVGTRFMDLTDGVEESMFNDAFWDMKEDLEERFG